MIQKLTGNRCQCPACRDFFNSTSTFDRHRTGHYANENSRRCLTAAELTARGWSRNALGFWIERAMHREAATTRTEPLRAPAPATTLQATHGRG